MAGAKYRKFVKEFDERERSDPINLVSIGDFSQAHLLPDTSLEACEMTVSDCNKTADRIRDAGYPGETIDERIDMMVAEDMLRYESLLFSARLNDGVPMVAACPDALQNLVCWTPEYIERDPRPSSKTVGSFLSRMRSIKRYLDNELSRLDRPFGPWTRLEIEAGEGFDAACRTYVRLAESIGYDNMDAVFAVIDNARPVVRRYINKLREMPKRRDVAVGYDDAQSFFDFTAIPYGLDHIHELALQSMDEARKRLSRLKGAIVRKNGYSAGLSMAGFASALKKRHRCPRNRILREVRDMLGWTTEFAYDNGIVKPLEDEESFVHRTPGYMRTWVPIAAMMGPSPLLEGTRRSDCYITFVPEVETEFNRLILPNYTAHELVPGHHYQLSRAADHPSLIRKWGGPNDLIEGWATFVGEEIMYEEGFLGDPDFEKEEHFIAQLDLLRMGARVCFTLALLTGDREYLYDGTKKPLKSKGLFPASIEMYRRNTGFDRERAFYDVAGFSSMPPVAAMYLLGNHMFKSLVGRGEKSSNGAGFNRNDFLELVLQEGNIPLYYIEKALVEKDIIS